MFKLYVLYSHLFATCTALGVILALDLHLLGRLGRSGQRPGTLNRPIERLMTGSMLMLHVTGAALVALGLHDRTLDLQDSTLIGKLLLAVLMTANVVVLRRRVVPHLTRPASLLAWRPAQRLTLALPVALANSLWASCVGLGLALMPGYVMPVPATLGLTVLLFASLSAALMWQLERRSRPPLAVPTRSLPRRREYDEHQYLAM